MALVQKRPRVSSPLRGALNPFDADWVTFDGFTEDKKPKFEEDLLTTPSVRRRLFSLDEGTKLENPVPQPRTTFRLVPSIGKPHDWSLIKTYAAKYGAFVALHEAWHQKGYAWFKSWSRGLSKKLPMQDAHVWAIILCQVMSFIQDQAECFPIMPTDVMTLSLKECQTIARKYHAMHWNPSDFVFGMFIQDEIEFESKAFDCASFDTKTRLKLDKKRPTEIWIECDEHQDSVARLMDEHFGVISN